MPDDRPSILVDVDGTLVDTNYFHVVTWWRAFRDIGEDVAMSRIHPLIGMGSDQLIQRAIGRESEEASDAHSRHYEAFKEEITAFPRAAELLRELARRGGRVVLATSSDEEDLDRLREAIGAEDAVEDAVSKSDVEQSKPSPDIFEAALEKFDLNAGRTLVVGDTTWDVEAAGKLELEVIGVLTGGTTREELEEAGAIAVYEDVAELLAHLDESLLGALLDGSTS
ncbi:MAG: HAD family hydrolase [Actinomycetota bacterium]|jgi:HAD superfamily hydrolase (TIGR01509 family)|nr:HAD family hydrolase [Actinomycetota bacterium]